jgi:hypothetical protein
MNNIETCLTRDLVEELKRREGVEFVNIGVEDRCRITIDNEYDECIYSSRQSGPEIILRIID